MENSRKAGLGMMALVVLALVAAYMVGATTLGGVFASSSAQTPPSSSAQQSGGTSADQQKAQAAAKEQQVLNNFIANFTSRLGVTEAKLNSSFVDAVNATADQAVHDGTLTQAQADDAKAMVQKDGFRGLIERGFSSSGSQAVSNPGDQYANPKAALIATMNKIGVSNDELQRGVDAGKSLADLAREHNVDAATLKNMILQTYRSQLNMAVQAGHLTQAQSDVEYEKFAQGIDDILSATHKSAYKSEIDGPTEAAQQAAWNAAPPILGIQAVDMKQALGGDHKTLTNLAREHSVNPQTLRSAMLQAGKAELDKAVAAKTITQVQADSDYNPGLIAWIDTLFNQGIQ